MNPLKREIIEFSILKELVYNNNVPVSDDYKINEDLFVSLFKHMVSAGLLNPKRLIFNILGTVEIDNELDLVTSKGYDFIENHEGWNELYSNLSDLSKLLGKENLNDSMPGCL